jgi:hypothetical protein
MLTADHRIYPSVAEGVYSFLALSLSRRIVDMSEGGSIDDIRSQTVVFL